MQHRPTRIAVDAVGGDFAPVAVLEGVTAALAADVDLTVLLVGPDSVVNAFAAQHPRAEGVVADDTIGMQEHGASAVRAKKESSIVVGCRLVRDGEADAFFSAGNTGAMMAAGVLVTGRLPGVMRPAIGTALPTTGDPCVMLDVGANADCKAEHLAQFAHMGRAYAQAAMGIAEPRVALLNIGEEATKGSLLAQEAHALMAATVPGFIGNVEGRDIPTGAADVIVTDGFTGNVVLKLLEGTGAWLFDEIRQAATSSWQGKLGGLLLRPKLRPLRDKVNPDTYGGSYLIGLRAIAVKAHGDSGSVAISNALRHAARGVREGLIEDIARRVHPEPRAAGTAAAPESDTAETA